MEKSPFTPDLIAPCGMNCGICKQYLAKIHSIPKQRAKVSHCAGCLPRGKNCYVKRGCKQLTNHQIRFCYQCAEAMPCPHLARLDKRYGERYGMSMVENQNLLKDKGIDEFLKIQEQRYRCPSCGDVVCVHDGKCYNCNYQKQA